jgi:hypothetical protein
MVTQVANVVKSPQAKRLATGFVCATSLVGLLALGMLWAFPATARHKPVIFIGLVEPPQVDAETGLFVGDVSRLHDVLEELRNNPAAMGLTSSAVTIQLAEHAIYRLDPSQPEEGRVQLAARTGRAGGNRYTDDRDAYGNPGADGIPDAIGIDTLGNQIFARRQTIIDGRGLTGGRAVVEAGLDNFICNLTVWGTRDPVPGGDNVPNAEIRLLLTDQDNVGSLDVDGVICEKGRRGIQVRGDNSAQMYLTVRRSILRDHADPLDVAWGLQLQPENISGVRFSATLRDNRINNNGIGIFLAILGTHDAKITINSYHNVIEANGTGISSLPRDVNLPEGILRTRITIRSVKDMIWNNGPPGGGVLARGYLRDLSGVEIRDIETRLQFLGTRFVKLTASGAFDGPQNRTATTRRDLRIVGAVLAAPDLTGPTSDISVSLLQRHTQSSLMPTTYDAAPQPISINDNAPDVVDITILGCRAAYERTNAGVNVPDASLFEADCDDEDDGQHGRHNSDNDDDIEFDDD